MEEFAEKCIHYVLTPGLTKDMLSPDEQKLLTEEYKISSLQKMTDTQLVEIIMTQPSVVIEKPDSEKPMITHKVSLEPLTNLTFCRDQQITTAKGVVLGSMRMVQRVCYIYFFVVILFKYLYIFL